MRTYERTHPWITFNLDLRRATFRHWLLLGEAQSKCVHIAGVPLLPQVTQLLHGVFVAKGVLATTAIEGNTLTEEEVRKRLEGKLTLPPSKEYLGQEIDNIIEACNVIAGRTLSGQPVRLSVDDIKHYNALVLRNLPLGEDIVPGEIRQKIVGVGRYRGAPPEDCAYLLGELCGWLERGFGSSEIPEIALGVLKAIIAHLYIVWIHPFDDGNGRTARLIELQVLLSVGVSTPVAHLLSNHYNQTRTEYYRQLDAASKSDDGIFSFIEYALRGFVDGLKEQIDVIQMYQLMVHWTNHIYNQFRDKDRPADVRRRHLILDLSPSVDRPSLPGVTPHVDVRRITPRIAEAYAGKTDKTVRRDLRVLETMNLIETTAAGVRANLRIMQTYLPPQRAPG
jgi:Fic family protein